MNPVTEVTTEILPSIFQELTDAPFFPRIVPEKYQSLENTPFFKVESVNDKNGSYGSDRYNSRTYKIQIMIFIDLNVTDIEELIDRLDRGLESHEYQQIYGDDRPHSDNDKIQVVTRQYTIFRRK